MRYSILYIFCLLLVNNIYSQADTAKAELTLYKDGCKLLDSAKYKDAIILFKKAIKEKNDYIPAYNKMARAKMSLEDLKGAEKDLQTALKISSNDFETQKNLAIIFYKTKRFKESKQMMDSAFYEKGEDAELLYYKAKLMFDGKANKLALDACAQSLDLNPKYFDVIILKAEIRFAMKEYPFVVKELTDAIKLLPADKPNYDAYKLRAKARFEIGDYKNATKDWTIYLENFPQEEAALVARGACKIESADFQGAISDLDAAIKINDKNPVSFNYRGVAKGENKQFVDGLKDLDIAIKLRFNYAEAFVNRAAIKFASKDKQGACEDLNKADSLGDEMAIRLIETYCKR